MFILGADLFEEDDVASDVTEDPSQEDDNQVKYQ